MDGFCGVKYAGERYDRVYFGKARRTGLQRSRGLGRYGIAVAKNFAPLTEQGVNQIQETIEVLREE